MGYRPGNERRDRGAEGTLVDLLAQIKREARPGEVRRYQPLITATTSARRIRFPKSTLLIGKGDWDALTSAKPPERRQSALVSNWISGDGKVEPVPLDKDVFGDGTVIML